jgi:monoamine oxidase
MNGRMPDDIEVLIVGAGIAGLYAGWCLAHADVPFHIVEADSKTGGRIQSRPEHKSKLGLVLDEGANLINSTDRIAIALMDRFGINYVRRLKTGSESMHYFYRGQHLEQAAFDKALLADSPAAIEHILNDQMQWQRDSARDVNPFYIDDSIAAYLTRVGSGPLLRDMLWSFFWSEYGQALDDLNLYVLFDYLELQRETPAFRLIPHVDEAYTVPEGAEQMTDGMLRDIGDRITLSCPVTTMHDDGTRIAVTTIHPQHNVHTLRARHVFFAAPLHAFRQMDVSVEGLTLMEVDQARMAAYGRGTKLHMKFAAGFHHRFPHAGILLTDTGEQIWTSSEGQGDVGLLTVLTGPLDAHAAEAKAQNVLAQLESFAPGLKDLFIGFEQSDAPQSYSGALRPGEFPHLSIHEGGPRLTMMGEASGGALQGYLEGALRSADAGVTRYLKQRPGFNKSN